MREYAKVAGYALFDPGPGVLCKHGHRAIRRVDNGECVECSRLRSLRRSRIKAAEPGFKEARSIRRRALYDTNRMAEREKLRNYYQANKARCLEYHKRSDEKHHDRKLKRMREWAARNPELVRINRHERRARQHRAAGSHSVADIKWLYASQNGLCVVCRRKLGKGYHVDHIVPLVGGGTNDRRNLQILCEPCNRSKHAKDPITFMQSRGFLL